MNGFGVGVGGLGGAAGVLALQAIHPRANLCDRFEVVETPKSKRHGEQRTKHTKRFEMSVLVARQRAR